MGIYFKTPLGGLVPVTGLKPSIPLNGNVVDWGNGIQETLPSNLYAQRYLAAMVARFMALPSQAAGYVEDLSFGVILEVSPKVFNPFTDTITVIGVGFYKPLMGGGAELYIENDTMDAHAMDSNGLHMIPTFVSATSFTAVYTSNGDGQPFATSSSSSAGPVLMYYQDSSSVKGNGLRGTVDAASNVTMSYP